MRRFPLIICSKSSLLLQNFENERRGQQRKQRSNKSLEYKFLDFTLSGDQVKKYIRNVLGWAADIII
jgi:hypothetical protein